MYSEQFYENPLGGSVLPSHTMLGYEVTRSSDHQAEQEAIEVSQRSMSLLTRLLHAPQRHEDGSQDLDQLMQVNGFLPPPPPPLLFFRIFNFGMPLITIFFFKKKGEQKFLMDWLNAFVNFALFSPPLSDLFSCTELPKREIWRAHGTRRKWTGRKRGLHGRWRPGIVIFLCFKAIVKNWFEMRKKNIFLVRRSWRKVGRRISSWIPRNLSSHTASRRSILICARSINRICLHPKFVAAFLSLDGNVCYAPLRTYPLSGVCSEEARSGPR